MARIGSFARVHWRLGIALLLTWASFLISPLYMIHLRHRLAQDLPEEWSKVTNNGPFTYVSPLLVTARNIEEGEYATRVAQILRFGFPYDPHDGEHSLRSWVFDSMSFYPLAPFAWIAGRDVQKGWILAHATLGALWVLLFYSIFYYLEADPLYALAFAVGGFFLMDSLEWIFVYILPVVFSWPPPLGPYGLGNALFLWISRPFGPVQFMRLPTPGMTYLWMFGAMTASYILAFSPKRRLPASLLVGCGLGLLSLSHAFEWTFGVGTVFLLLAAGFFLDGMPAEGRRNLIRINAVSLSMSVAYYLSARYLTRGIMPDIIARMGTQGRNFYPKTLLNLALAAFFWRASKHQGRARWFFVFEALQELAAFLGSNGSLVLGYNMQFVKYQAIGDFTGTVGMLAWLSCLPSVRKSVRPHALVLAGAVFAMVFMREKCWADTHFKIFGTPRDVAAAEEWMDRNVPRDSMLLCLSGILNEVLPLKIQMRYPAFNGGLALGPARSNQDNIEGFARLLKTLRVNPQRFIEERVYDYWKWDEQKQKITYLTRNVAWDEAVRASWAYFLFNMQCMHVREDGLDRRMLKAYEEVRPLPPPYYLWLQKGDETFLPQSPEALGGTLIYSNPSVRLYEFKKLS